VGSVPSEHRLVSQFASGTAGKAKMTPHRCSLALAALLRTALDTPAASIAFNGRLRAYKNGS
jgi:acyl-coenzyme A synthetase/AMP-(fatty) acid ligase